MISCGISIFLQKISILSGNRNFPSDNSKISLKCFHGENTYVPYKTDKQKCSYSIQCGQWLHKPSAHRVQCLKFQDQLQHIIIELVKLCLQKSVTDLILVVGWLVGFPLGLLVPSPLFFYNTRCCIRRQISAIVDSKKSRIDCKRLVEFGFRISGFLRNSIQKFYC